MLNGKELGRAIEKAFKLKKETGAISSKADIALHFGIKTPSVYDWVKKGSISKDKLPELFRYFSDVVDYAHWGMTEDEWPAGLKTRQAGDEKTKEAVNQEDSPQATAVIKPKTRRQERIDMIVELLHQTDMEGLAVILDRARDAGRDYPAAKQTPASSA